MPLSHAFGPPCAVATLLL